MKKVAWMAVIGLLVMPVVASAQTSFVNMNVVSNGLPAIEIEPGVAGVIPMTMMVDANGPIDGLQWKIRVNGTADGGADAAKFSYVSHAVGGMFGFAPTQFLDIPNVISDLTLGYASAPRTLDGQTGAGLNPHVVFKNSGFYNNGYPGNLVTFQISYGPLDPGTFLFTAAGVATQTGNTASPFQLGGEGLLVTVTPEPASALLLLAAVPFLRRRRA